MCHSFRIIVHPIPGVGDFWYSGHGTRLVCVFYLLLPRPKVISTLHMYVTYIICSRTFFVVICCLWYVYCIALGRGYNAPKPRFWWFGPLWSHAGICSRIPMRSSKSGMLVPPSLIHMLVPGISEICFWGHVLPTPTVLLSYDQIPGVGAWFLVLWSWYVACMRVISVAAPPKGYIHIIYVWKEV